MKIRSYVYSLKIWIRLLYFPIVEQFLVCLSKHLEVTEHIFKLRQFLNVFSGRSKYFNKLTFTQNNVVFKREWGYTCFSDLKRKFKGIEEYVKEEFHFNF